MEPFLNKKYKLVSSENFDEYMKALGVGFITRKIGNTTSPTIELRRSGDEYTLATSSTFKNTAVSFRPGEEFEEDTVDGRKVRSRMDLEDNRLTHVQRGEKDTTIVREFFADEVKATMTIDDIVCTRVYKLVE